MEFKYIIITEIIYPQTPFKSLVEYFFKLHVSNKYGNVICPLKTTKPQILELKKNIIYFVNKIICFFNEDLQITDLKRVDTHLRII